MDATTLSHVYLDLTTPHIADACMRLGVDVRCAPTSVRPLWNNIHLAGRARPVAHHGSVDVFLEAIDHAEKGEVLVVDNGGREDEACVGDLIALETASAGLAGIVIWGLHRDTVQLKAIHLPVFSGGSLPNGPDRGRADGELLVEQVRCGDHIVTRDDYVVADDDGVVFVPMRDAPSVADLATVIRDTERTQAAKMITGTTFRTQSQFDDYRAARESDSSVTFRDHLRSIGRAIEE
ncbi:RraA family protein [Rhodococcoides fascians]|uniref:RraA family protein n=1 Tax=Rhodococcoides fascians TaxID=1828 RepID=UPI00056D4012|nr:RraA family protein [Rhodococcus fascians]